MKAVERFMQYITYDTQSEEDADTIPSTEKQRILGRVLVKELMEIGLEGVHLDEYGYVYGWFPATKGQEEVPVIGLIAHMDTAPRVSGQDVQARIVQYDGGDLILNADKGIVMRPSELESLQGQIGKSLIVTDGTTLLGADDKAGLAEIVTAMDYLKQHPEIPHGRIAVGFTPDEEVGRGADRFDVKKFGASVAFTVDGGELGELEYENFNAAQGLVLIRGINIHPGEAKDKMKNALLIAVELVNMLPSAETPAHTEGYEGFYHVCGMEADESSARLSILIRDHQKEKFAARKRMLERITAYLNEKYGDQTVELAVKDSYYNMKEPLQSHMAWIERAAEAFRQVGVTPKEVPIRGGTDGARLSYMGLPCPNLSTGGFHFHGIYEYIPVESLEKMTQMLVFLVRSC